MKKIVLWAMSTVTALVLLFGYHTSTSSKAASGSSAIAPIGGGTATSGGDGSGTAAPSSSAAAPSSSAAAPSSSAAAPSSSAAAPPARASTGSSGTRTVTGAAVDTRYGPVRVRITVQDQKVTHVSVVEYPQESGRDMEINSSALPILIRETLDAQSAHIDMVSGATYTSDGYLTSLQSALDRAGL